MSFTLIAGPCVIESPELVFQVAERMQTIAERLGINYIFKASFDKANRSSGAPSAALESVGDWRCSRR